MLLNMKWLLVLCALVAITQIVSARPNKDEEDYEVLNDDGPDTTDTIYSDEDEDDIEDESPPVMLSKPQHFTVNAGESIELPCHTENTEMVTILWLKDLKLMYQDKLQFEPPNPRISRLDNQSLLISNVNVEDAGLYVCRISTEPVSEVLHQLRVRYPPKIHIEPEGDTIRINAGDILRLNCRAHGEPMPKVTWSVSGSRLSQHVDESFTGSSVVIENVSRENAGYYQCMADNKIGKPAVHGIHVIVHHAPIVKIQKLIVNSSEVWLECKVHASPKATVTWLKHNETVQLNERIRLDHSHHGHDLALKFTTVEPSDSGDYYCRARNSFGVTEKHIKLNMKPTTPTLAESELVTHGGHRIAKWTMESLSPVTECEMRYREQGENDWKREKLDFEENNNSYSATYTFMDLDPITYVVQVRAKNKHGWSPYSEARTIKPGYEIEMPESISEIVEESAVGSTSRIQASLSILFAVVLSLCSSAFV